MDAYEPLCSRMPIWLQHVSAIPKDFLLVNKMFVCYWSVDAGLWHLFRVLSVIVRQPWLISTKSDITSRWRCIICCRVRVRNWLHADSKLARLTASFTTWLSYWLVVPLFLNSCFNFLSFFLLSILSMSGCCGLSDTLINEYIHTCPTWLFYSVSCNYEHLINDCVMCSVALWWVHHKCKLCYCYFTTPNLSWPYKTSPLKQKKSTSSISSSIWF